MGANNKFRFRFLWRQIYVGNFRRAANINKFLCIVLLRYWNFIAAQWKHITTCDLCTIQEELHDLCTIREELRDLCTIWGELHVDGIVQDCSNSSALAMELLQFST